MLKSLSNLKVVASYLEEAKGVSPEKWEKMSEPEQQDYIKKHPTSTYAKKNKAIKSDKYNYSKLTPEIRKVLASLASVKKIITKADGSIDIKGSINFTDLNEDALNTLIDKNGHLKIKFNDVSGSFKLPKGDIIKTLEGCPKKVGEDFVCHLCTSLESLKGAPEYVAHRFSCNACDKLESLEGAPKIVGNSFYCNNCTNLKSLKGAPEKVKQFQCIYCSSLKNLEGAPKEVNGDFDCSECPDLESFKGGPEKIDGNFLCTNYKNLKSLEGAPKEIGGDFELYIYKNYYNNDTDYKLFSRNDIKKYSNVKGVVRTKES